MALATIGRDDLGTAIVPDAVSQEIIQETPKQSVVLNRARHVPMSAKKEKQPVLASLPEAAWVNGDDGLKTTSKTGWEDVYITAEELAVIVPIPDSVVDDSKVPLWDQIKPLIAEAFGKKIDEAAIFGADKPASWGPSIFDAASTAKLTVTETANVAKDVAELGQKIARTGFSINGFATQPGSNWELVGLTDTTGRPIYTPQLSETVASRLYGYELNEVTNGAWDSTKAKLLAADWSKFAVGIRQDITYKIFDQGVITDTNGKVLYNLMQQDAKALRVVMRVGFTVANPLTRLESDKTKRYPAGFIVPKTSGSGS